MRVEINNTQVLYKLDELETLTGIPFQTLVNAILDAHLDQDAREVFVSREMSKRLEILKEKQGLTN